MTKNCKFFKIENEDYDSRSFNKFDQYSGSTATGSGLSGTRGTMINKYRMDFALTELVWIDY